MSCDLIATLVGPMSFLTRILLPLILAILTGSKAWEIIQPTLHRAHFTNELLYGRNLEFIERIMCIEGYTIRASHLLTLISGRSYDRFEWALQRTSPENLSFASVSLLRITLEIYRTELDRLNFIDEDAFRLKRAVKSLLDHGSVPCRRDILTAIELEDSDVLEAILAKYKGKKSRKFIEFVLRKCKSMDVLKSFLKAGVDPNISLPDYGSLMTFALDYSPLPTSACKTLLEYGADPNSQHIDGWPALGIAYLSRRMSVVMMLTARGARLSEFSRFLLEKASHWNDSQYLDIIDDFKAFVLIKQAFFSEDSIIGNLPHDIIGEIIGKLVSSVRHQIHTVNRND